MSRRSDRLNDFIEQVNDCPVILKAIPSPVLTAGNRSHFVTGGLDDVRISDEDHVCRSRTSDS